VERERLAALARPCLPYLDTAIVNDHEVGAIAGIETIKDERTDVDACVAAARKVLEGGPMRFVAVHFPKGGLIVCRDGTELRRPSVNVPPDAVAAANGAGDAFASGLLYGVLKEWSLEDSLVLAHSVAAASLRALSTVEGVAPWKECLALAEQWGWREAI
jgi:sugar/nucleoside kinase (ribokinase family)